MSALPIDIDEPILSFTLFERLAPIPEEPRFPSQFGVRNNASWAEFVETMRAAAKESWGPTKAHAFGVTSAIFQNDHRCAANVLSSQMLFLDYDKGIVSIEMAANALATLRLPALIWTTYSHRLESHRFRVCVPLAEPVDTDTHVECWHYLHQLTGVGADLTKIGPESGFYLPGAYNTGDDRLIELSGKIPTSDQIKEIAPAEVAAAVQAELVRGIRTPTAAANCKPLPSGISQMRSRLKRQPVGAFEITDPAKNPLVGADALDLYKYGPGAWHHKLYALMCSIAGRAKALNVQLTAHQLATLYGRIDGDLWYRTKQDRNDRVEDAEHALTFVGS